MRKQIVSRYETATGKNALVISVATSPRGSFYSYTGKYGAGSGHDEGHIREIVASCRARHKGMVHVYGISFH